MKKFLPVLFLFLIAALGLRGEGGIGLYIPVVGDYVTAAGATNVAFMVTTNLAPTLHVSHADTATAILGPDGSTLWKVGSTNYVVTPDTNRVYIVSASQNFNMTESVSVLLLTDMEGSYLRYLSGTDATLLISTDPEVDDIILTDNISEDTRSWANAEINALNLPKTLSLAFGSAIGSCTIDYVPVTNITVDVSAATFIIIAAQVETNRTDIAALEVGQAARPTFAATTNIVTAEIGTHNASGTAHATLLASKVGTNQTATTVHNAGAAVRVQNGTKYGDFYHNGSHTILNAAVSGYLYFQVAGNLTAFVSGGAIYLNTGKALAFGGNEDVAMDYTSTRFLINTKSRYGSGTVNTVFPYGQVIVSNRVQATGLRVYDYGTSTYKLGTLTNGVMYWQ